VISVFPMEPSFNEFSKVVTKHVLGSQERFNELKERMEMCEHATSKAGAAALGYLIAMEEKGSRNIYDVVLEQVENNGEDGCVRTEAIFAAIYKWLDGRLAEEGYFDDEGTSRSVLHEAFDIYMVT
jgi:hypothetical protein